MKRLNWTGKEKYLFKIKINFLKGNEPVISCGVKSSGVTLPILSKNVGKSNEQYTQSLVIKYFFVFKI